MIDKSTRESCFFLIMFLMFFLFSKANGYLIETGKVKIPKEGLIIILALIFTVLMIIIYRIARISPSKEGFWDVSEFAKCKGGPYFWQGNSEQSKICRALADTSEGRCGLASYNCPTGFVGTPSLPFVYTPLSGDNFEDERCDNKPTCKSCPYEEQKDMSSFTKYVN